MRRLWHQVVSPPGVMLALLALGNRDARGEPATIHGGARLPVSGLAIAGAWSAGALLRADLLSAQRRAQLLPDPAARTGGAPDRARRRRAVAVPAAARPRAHGRDRDARADRARRPTFRPRSATTASTGPQDRGRPLDRGSRAARCELVVASDYGSRHIDPRLLFRSDRDGWPVAIPNLTPPILAKLVDNGARWVAVVTDPSHPELSPPKFLEPARVEQRPIVRDGATLGTLHPTTSVGCSRPRAGRERDRAPAPVHAVDAGRARRADVRRHRPHAPALSARDRLRRRGR